MSYMSTNYETTKDAYDIGDNIRFKATFISNTTFHHIDPTSVKFFLRKPDLSIVTLIYGQDPQVVRKDQGVYYCDYQIDQGGKWIWRWQSEGLGQAAEEKRFFVNFTGFGSFPGGCQ